MVTNARQWQSKTPTNTMPLELPSGNTALVRPVKPEAFLTGGLLPDSLTSIVQQAIGSKRGMPDSVMKNMVKDPKQLADALETFDRMLVYCVIEPEVEMPPQCVHEQDGPCGKSASAVVHMSRDEPGFHRYTSPERDPDILYADVVDMEDKQFIFQWAVGGVSDVATFRDKLVATMEPLATG